MQLHLILLTCDWIRTAATGSQVFIQLLANCQTRPMQPRLDHILRQIEDLGGLQRGQLLHVPHQKDRLVVFGQLADRLIQHMLHFRLHELTIGQSGPIRDLEFGMAALVVHCRHEVVQRQFLRRGENALPPLHQASVSSNPKDPRPDSLRLPKLIEALEDLQQCVLRHVFRILALAAHQPAVMENLGPEVLHEAVERVRVSRHESSCEIDFRFPFQWSVPLPIVTGFPTKPARVRQH